MHIARSQSPIRQFLVMRLTKERRKLDALQCGLTACYRSCAEWALRLLRQPQRQVIEFINIAMVTS